MVPLWAACRHRAPGTVSGADLLESTGIRLRFHIGSVQGRDLDRLSPGASQWAERHPVPLYMCVLVGTVLAIPLTAMLIFPDV